MHYHFILFQSTHYFKFYLKTILAIGNAYLQEMNSMKLQGEVTFLPLDRLQAEREDYPKASDALPLIDKITFNEGNVPHFS